MDLVNRIIASLKTYIRGIALPGEKPLFIVTPMMVVSASAFSLVFDLAATQLVWRSQQPWLYPLFLPLLALGQASIWNLAMVLHQATHQAISPKKIVNQLVAEAASIIALAESPFCYRLSHGSMHHDQKRLATIDDPDYRGLFRLGFHGGRPVGEYWAQILKVLRSPSFYLSSLASRLRGHLFEGPLAHRASLLLWWMALATLAERLNWWPALLLYLALLVWAFPTSAFLETLTEHAWLHEQPELRSHPRLLPIDQASPTMALLYLYWRAAVVPLELSLHSLHHESRRLNSLEWPMLRYTHEAAAHLWKAQWGVRSSFVVVFASLSKAKPPSEAPKP